MQRVNYVRLRQICLAARDIQEAESMLGRIFGLDVCHRSQLPEFGLENILFAMNGGFLEIVVPTREDTAVSRFLQRSGGEGGYMAIFDSADVVRHKALAEEKGVLPVYERYDARAHLLQLNPRTSGATMLEFDHHNGGEDLTGAYHWAGEHWQRYVNTDVTGEITGIEIRGPAAAARAKLWAHICDRPLEGREDGAEIRLDYGRVRFTVDPAAPRDLFTAIDITARDPAAMCARAEKAGARRTPGGFACYGVEFRPVPFA